MDNLSLGILTSSLGGKVENAPKTMGYPAPLEGRTDAPARPPQVDQFRRIRRTICVGFGGRIPSDYAILPQKRKRGQGHINNIGSIAGSLSTQGVDLYSATKSFLGPFSSALHRELRGSGVRVSVVKPGPVRSEFYTAAARRPQGQPIPAHRFAIRPETVADCIWSLLCRPRRLADVPPVLSLVPWAKLPFGWPIDRLGPLLFCRRPPSPDTS